MARDDDKREEGKDDSFFQMPALGMGHDDSSVVDAKELLVTSNGTNPAAADAVLVVTTTKTAADILAEYGYASPSTEADPARLGPVRQVAAAAATEVRCVPGGLLPGDLVDAASRCRHSCKTPARPRQRQSWPRWMPRPRRPIEMTGSATSYQADKARSGPARPVARRLGEGGTSFLLLPPVLALFAVSVLYPLLETLCLSLHDIKGLATATWVGLGNDATLFSDPAFRATAPFRLMIFMAFGISESVSGHIWISMLRPDQAGLLNAVIGLVSPGFSHAWLGDETTAFWVIIIGTTRSGAGHPAFGARGGLSGRDQAPVDHAPDHGGAADF